MVVWTNTLTYKQAFSAFGNDTIWLIIGAFFFAKVSVGVGVGVDGCACACDACVCVLCTCVWVGVDTWAVWLHRPNS